MRPLHHEASTPWRSRMVCPLALVSGLGLGAPRLVAQDWVTFDPPTVLSEESPSVPGGAAPGLAGDKVRIMKLEKTPGGRHDGRLVVVYLDAATTDPVWHPKDGLHEARDVFARVSDDDGRTWTDPVNLSRTAGLYSAETDWDGDGTREPYRGDSGKPNLYAKGDRVVVTWVDRYCPEEGWAFGDVGISVFQGSAFYPDIDVYPNQREMPFGGLCVAVSGDGGDQWIHGGTNPPLQITYGRRDANFDFHRGAGDRWYLVWQEDPLGLQMGEGEGPGDGGSGAKTSMGTDVWYSWTDDVAGGAVDLRDHRRPLSNHSFYDRTQPNGFPMVGAPGAFENHAASRPSLQVSTKKGVTSALIAYEETKGADHLIQGKTLQYHAFPGDAPPITGSETQATGGPGTTLTGFYDNARRARLVVQPYTGFDPAVLLLWREGRDPEGAPADIMARLAVEVDEAAVLAARTLNLSSETETATGANLDDPTDLNALEDARAHRAILKGPSVVVAYTYTPNQPVARYTDLECYELWLRRSADGGATWFSPQNVSLLPDTSVNVHEPRLVSVPRTGVENEAVLVLSWATLTNVYEGFAEPEPLDLWVTRSGDRGATLEPNLPLRATPDRQYESQLQLSDDGLTLFAVWLEEGVERDAMFAAGRCTSPLWVELENVPVPGGRADLRFHAAGFEGADYVAAASLGTSPGIPTPFGMLPLNLDVLLRLSLRDRSTFTGFQGTISGDGRAQGAVHLVDDPALHGFGFFVAFVAVPGDPRPWGLSRATEVLIQ